MVQGCRCRFQQRFGALRPARPAIDLRERRPGAHDGGHVRGETGNQEQRVNVEAGFVEGGQVVPDSSAPAAPAEREGGAQRHLPPGSGERAARRRQRHPVS